MFTTTYSKSAMTRILAMFLCVFMLAGFVMMASTTTAYCGDDDALETDIPNAVTSVMDKIYRIARSVIVPICIVALCFAGFQFILGGNQGAEKARKIALGCAGAVGIVVFAPLIVKSIANVVSSYGGSDLDSYNPLS